MCMPWISTVVLSKFEFSSRINQDIALHEHIRKLMFINMWSTRMEIYTILEVKMQLGRRDPGRNNLGRNDLKTFINACPNLSGVEALEWCKTHDRIFWTEKMVKEQFREADVAKKMYACFIYQKWFLSANCHGLNHRTRFLSWPFQITLETKKTRMLSL